VAVPTHAPRRPRGEEALERTLFVGITAFRWAAWAWMAIAFTVDVQRGVPGSVEEVDNPGAGYALIVVALAFTVWASLELRRQKPLLDSAPAVVVDVLLAMSLVALDPWIYQSPHSQRLGANWAIASVLSAGVVFAGRGGFTAGFVVGLSSLAGRLLWTTFEVDGDDMLASLSAIFIYSIGGAVAGFFAIRLREAEREVAAAQAREEVARTLHDGVLQTLAVIQRRSTDDELVRLAREQELDLRQFLVGVTRPGGDLVTALREVAARFERTHETRAEVIALDGLPKPADAVTQALTGAVTEALTNAAKHGGATRVTVYVEPTDEGGLFCSVKDDGRGFDVGATDEGTGLTRSIRGRIAEVGGTVEIVSRPDRGTEVRLTLA
jgi:signal transduction histidine kinase